MRGQGRVFRPTWTDPTTGETKVAETWRLDYSVNGTRYREAASTTSKREALALLYERTGGRRAGKVVGNPDRVVLAEYEKGDDGTAKLAGGLRALVERQYALDGRTSVARVAEAFTHLEAFFGAEARVAQITKTNIDAYAEHRLAAGRARATVNNELAQLRRGFRLAIEAGLLAVMPVFKLPKPQNARSGFFEEGEIAALLLELPADVRDLVQFLRATGWRRDEGRLLTWAAVDRDGGTIRLEEARSKSGKPRVFPFALAPSLKALLEARWEARGGLYVFHRQGEPLGVGAVRAAWRRAVRRAGLVGRIVHDLRRSAARDFRRAGVSEGEIMQLCGWETRSMFDRYNIIDEADLAAAVAKRFNGQGTAKSAPSTESSPRLS
jgi:integrase